MQTGAVVPSMSRAGHRILRVCTIVGSLALLLPFAANAWHQALGAPLPHPLHIVLMRLPVLFPIHMAASATALALVPLALASSANANLHRMIGRLAVAAIGLGGATAMIVAPMSVAPAAARLGFLVQGIVWLGLAASGVIAIRRKRRRLHARLMIAVAIVTLAPVLLRLALLLAVQHRWPFAPTYAALAWGSWLLPLALYAFYLMAQTVDTPRPQLVGALQTATPE